VLVLVIEEADADVVDPSEPGSPSPRRSPPPPPGRPGARVPASSVTARASGWWSTFANPRSSTGTILRRLRTSSAGSLPRRTPSRIFLSSRRFALTLPYGW